MPKYGVNLLLWTDKFDKESIELIPKVAKLGYDGVEIPIFAPEQVDIPATKAALEDNNLGCTGCVILGPDRDLINSDVAVRQNAKDYLKKCVEITQKLGGDTLIGPLYSAVGKLVGRGRTEEEWDICVEGLKEIAAFAGEHGVTLAVEPLNRFETYFINTAADAVKMAKAVDSPNLGVQLDTFHMNIEEKNLHDAIMTAGDVLYHMHCCENDRGTPGSGLVNWKDVFGALGKLKYNKWIVVESFVPGVEEIAKAAAIWRALAPSAEALASEGLAFLKRMGEEYLGN